MNSKSTYHQVARYDYTYDHFFFLHAFLVVACVLLALQAVSATDLDNFPDIPFKVFSGWVESQFNPKVTLATVLTVLFSMTENPDLLNLHAQQQHPRSPREYATALSGWIKTLSRAVERKLGSESKTLLQSPQLQAHMSPEATTVAIATKLDAMAKVLKLNPYNRHGHFVAKVNAISSTTIEPALVISPQAGNYSREDIVLAFTLGDTVKTIANTMCAPDTHNATS